MRPFAQPGRSLPLLQLLLNRLQALQSLGVDSLRLQCLRLAAWQGWLDGRQGHAHRAQHLLHVGRGRSPMLDDLQQEASNVDRACLPLLTAS